MRYCVHCKQEVQPKKKFRIGLFIGLFFLGLIFLVVSGYIIATAYTASVFVGFLRSGSSFQEIQDATATIAGFGLFFFFLCWLPYLLHYAIKKPTICPICGGHDFDYWYYDDDISEKQKDLIDERNRLADENLKKIKKQNKIFFTVLLGIGAFLLINMLLPFPYGLGVAFGSVIVIVWVLHFRKKHNNKSLK